jgi:hypothetical protein
MQPVKSPVKKRRKKRGGKLAKGEGGFKAQREESVEEEDEFPAYIERKPVLFIRSYLPGLPTNFQERRLSAANSSTKSSGKVCNITVSRCNITALSNCNERPHDVDVGAGLKLRVGQAAVGRLG